MTQEQLDIVTKDLVQTIKLLKGNPKENGLLFELSLIKNEMKLHTYQNKKNFIHKLILACAISFLAGWISCSIFYLGVKSPIIQEIENQKNVNTALQKVQSLNEQVAFKDFNEFEKEFIKFKFVGNTFEYKGQIFKEGDVIGNIRIEYIIPDIRIRVWNIKEGYPFVKDIQNK